MGLQRNAVFSLWIAALSLLAAAATSTAPSNAFVEVRPKLWRYNGEFAFLPSPAARTPVAVWLVEVKSSWILIDTGAASPEYREPFLEALKTQLNSFKNPLRLVLLTHGHVDHAGLLPYMLDEYPDVSFAVHEAEAPFITGSKQYHHLKGDTWSFAVGKWYMPAMNASLPVSRQLLLKGAKGDVASKVSWLPQNVLTYNHVPGHSPGQVFFTHHSTESVITGDVITNMSLSFPVSRKSDPKCDNPFAAPTHNWHDMKASQKALASVDGVETYFPSHDDGTGVTVADLKAFVGSEHEEL